MPDFLKSLLNLSNFFLMMSLLALGFYVFNKRKIFKALCYASFVLLLICSSNYIPKLLLSNLESKYPVLEPHSLDSTKQYYIHILGAGYSLDDRLPALSKMGTVSLGRLTEGIRIYRQLPRSKLVTSGFSSKGLQSQALVTKNAAIELGIPEENIEVLETPSNTLEEIKAFKDNFGTEAKVIIATDATHMFRAMKIYQTAGYEPIAAPTNFKVKLGPNSYNGLTLPSVNSILIMDQWIREELAMFKFVWTDSKIVE